MFTMYFCQHTFHPSQILTLTYSFINTSRWFVSAWTFGSIAGHFHPVGNISPCYQIQKQTNDFHNNTVLDLIPNSLNLLTALFLSLLLPCLDMNMCYLILFNIHKFRHFDVANSSFDIKSSTWEALKFSNSDPGFDCIKIWSSN